MNRNTNIPLFLNNFQYVNFNKLMFLFWLVARLKEY